MTAAARRWGASWTLRSRNPGGFEEKSRPGARFGRGRGLCRIEQPSLLHLCQTPQMGAAATHHPRLNPIDPLARHLNAEVHESRRLRRLASEMEYRDHLADMRLARAFARRRMTDLRYLQH